MAHTRDWDSGNYPDHSKFKYMPGFVRYLMADVAERLAAMFYGFASGETTDGVKNLPFTVQAGDPGATANNIKLYSKDVSAKAELHVQDEDGDVIQLTSGGAIKGLTGAELLAAVGPLIYPVGCTFVSFVSTNPNTLFGFGTWAAAGVGRVWVGIDGTQTEFDTLGETGGAKTHTLTAPQLPPHKHYAYLSGFGSESPGNGIGMLALWVPANCSYTNAWADNGGNTEITGAAHNNLQPYEVVYKWKRTA